MSTDNQRTIIVAIVALVIFIAMVSILAVVFRPCTGQCVMGKILAAYRDCIRLGIETEDCAIMASASYSVNFDLTTINQYGGN